MSCRAPENLGKSSSRQNDSRKNGKRQVLRACRALLLDSFFVVQWATVLFRRRQCLPAWHGIEIDSIDHSLGHSSKAHQYCPERFASPAPVRSSVNPSRVTLTETKHGTKKHCRPPHWRRVWSFNCETAKPGSRID